ncbi:hypothetical protein HC928_22275 [bacterium]|nr:hypothetical protein [bacterium]
MSQNLESDFQKALRRHKQKKRKLMMQKIGAFLLICCILLGLVYLIFNFHSISNLGNIIVGSIDLYLGIFGLIVVISLVVYAVRRPTIKNLYQSVLKRRKIHYLMYGKNKAILAVSLLLVALIYQANPAILDNPFKSFIIHLKYNPEPPIAHSPWPWNNFQTIHPAVATMPTNIETTIESVAKYIGEREKDPFLQIKALHDYVLSRVTYDLEVLKTGIRPAQDAKTVFLTHKAVCEGYARLFQELARAIGLDVAYIEGRIREDLAPRDLIPGPLRLLKYDYNWTLHAWNAVKVGAAWQLIDTTWDDGDSDSPYRSDYLMPPPNVMIASHFPDQQNWQLLHNSESHRSFEEQPILEPQFLQKD